VLLAAVLLYFGYWLELSGYFAALILHEFAHAQAAKRRGYILGAMKLMPYGANLKVDFDSASLRDEIAIALAGPALNLILAVFSVAVWWLAPVTYIYTEMFVYANLFTAVLNLLPVFPLDGGRIVLAAFSARFKRQSVYKYMRITGFIAAGIFAALFFFTFYSSANLSLAVMAVFFFLSTLIPDKHSKYRRLYSMAYRSEKVKKGMAVKEIVISGEAELLTLMRMLNANYFYRFTVVDGGMNIIGSVNELELETLAAKHGATHKVGTLVKKP